MSAYSRADRSVLPEDLRGAIAAIPAPSSRPAPSAEQPDAPDPEPISLTVRSVGSTGIIIEGRGIIRVGDTIEGWRLAEVSSGAALLTRGDESVRLRSGGVLDPASGAVSR